MTCFLKDFSLFFTLGYLVHFLSFSVSLTLYISGMSLLPYLIGLPLLGAASLLILPKDKIETQKVVGFAASCLTLVLSLVVYLQFNTASAKYQMVTSLPYVQEYGINGSLGIDGISLFLVLLTTLLVPLCLLSGWSLTSNVVEYFVAFLVLESFTLGVFLSLDLLLFYVFFEAVLIPMYFIIGIWGSRARKIQAAYMFFLYTLAGSLLMLLALVLIATEAGTTDLLVLPSLQMSFERQVLVWMAFFVAFGVKIPMVPMHVWLPEAHVEAPTGGSVFLAGIMLKLGGYGFLRLSLPLLPEASVYFSPLVCTLSLGAIVYTSLTTIRQIDLKKIVAYSSVAHMGVVTLGIFSLTQAGIEGALFLMLGHGFVSSALFVMIGALYDRYKTRLVHYYGGLVLTMPLFGTAFVMLSMANIGLPGTVSFVGEFLVLCGSFSVSSLLALGGAFGMILGGAYQLWVCNRIIFGLPKPWALDGQADLNRRETALLAPLLIGTVYFGVYPDPLLVPMHSSIAHLLGHLS
jgi:proton-translocating NADH-quinone oxidoreductase chain M